MFKCNFIYNLSENRVTLFIKFKYFFIQPLSFFSIESDTGIFQKLMR